MVAGPTGASDADVLRIPVILGTAREGNRSAWVARYARRLLAGREGVETTLLDVADHPFGDLVRRVWEMDDAERTAKVDEAVDVLSAADAFVVVFPEYNHGYPGAVKNLFDHFYDEWVDKPFGLVTTGGVSGGLRAQEMFRPVVNALGVAVPAGVAVTFVKRSFTEDGPVPDQAEDWERRFQGLFDELVRYARVLRPLRAEVD